MDTNMKTKTCFTTEDLVALLKKKQKQAGIEFQKDFADYLKINPSQLSDIYTGRRAIFNDKVLSFLKLKREVHFVPTE